MALFLNTQQISGELTTIIRDAKKRLILVSPYLQISDNLRRRLKVQADSKTLKEFIIVTDTGAKKAEKEWCRTLKNLRLIEHENVHAKVYMNEEKAVLCSMNLYQYSQQNNFEVGILISAKEDQKLYKDLFEEISVIMADDDPFKNHEPSKLQLAYYHLINDWRKQQAMQKNVEVNQIIDDIELKKIAYSKTAITSEELSKILSGDRSSDYCQDILKQIKSASKLTIGKINKVEKLAHPHQQIELELEDGNISTYEHALATQLPVGKWVAVSINKTWFNKFYVLD